MTLVPQYLGPLQWAPVPVPLNLTGSLLMSASPLAQGEVPAPEVAFKPESQQKSPPLSPLGSGPWPDRPQSGESSPLDYEEYYYSNMYRQLANRYNPQYKNKKPVHVAINQRTVNGLLSLLLLFIISVWGSTGAVLTISSLTVIESLQTRNNCYLVSLTLTNLFVTLLVIPTSALQIMTGDSLDGYKLCHYQWLLFEHSLLVSQLSFFLMAADNYLGYQCSQKVTITGPNFEAPGKLNRSLCNLLVCDHPLPKSTTTMMSNRASHHHQPVPGAPPDTEVLLNNPTDLLWPSYSNGQSTRPGLMGYRFCCGRLKVPVWIICTWLIALTCTLHQHESRYGTDFCLPGTTPSQHALTGNLSFTTAQNLAEQSTGPQAPKVLEGQVLRKRAARSLFRPHYLYNQSEYKQQLGLVSSASLKALLHETTDKTQPTPTARPCGARPLSGTPLDNWQRWSQQIIRQLKKRKRRAASFEDVHDSCHRNKCPGPSAAVPEDAAAHLTASVAATRVGGGKTFISPPNKQVPSKHKLSKTQPIKRVDESQLREMSAPEYRRLLQELVHHTWAHSWFNGSPERSPKHTKVPQSYAQPTHNERDLNGLFMNNNNNNNNNSNDVNNVARMQIARERRTVWRGPMHTGSTNDAGGAFLGGHRHSSATGDQQQHPATRIAQINRSRQVDQQQLAAKFRSDASTATSESSAKQWQIVNRSINGAPQLNPPPPSPPLPNKASPTSGATEKPQQQAGQGRWLLVLTISSLCSLLSTLLFGGAYLKMKEFKTRPYKPMPVDAMNAFVASLLRSGLPGASPSPSSPSRLTPEMTPLKHPHWPAQNNTGRPNSALAPLQPRVAPPGNPTLRSVSQPCGPTPGLHCDRARMEAGDLTWNQQQHRQLNQALSAPGGAVVCPGPSTYLSPAPTQQPAPIKTRPSHTHSFRHQPAPVVYSSSLLMANEQSAPSQKPSASAPMSQFVSDESYQLPTLERHRSLPPQSRATSSGSCQDKRLNLEDGSAPGKSRRARAIKPSSNQLHVPTETNNNNAPLAKSGAEPEVGVDAGAGEAVVAGAAGKQYNRAIICTYSYMTDEQLLKSNIIAFVVNLALWLPLILLTVMTQSRQPHHQLTHEFKNFVWWMATLNCCSCSYVYALTNKDFREAFNKLFYYCCCKSHVTFQKKTPIFRRQLDLDSKCNLRIHIIPGLNQFSSKLSRPQ